MQGRSGKKNTAKSNNGAKKKVIREYVNPNYFGWDKTAPAVPIRNRPTGSERQKGTDYLRTITIPQTVRAGELLETLMIDSQAGKRLAITCSRFQRVRWNPSSISITTGYPSSSGGIFATAFIRDPTDMPPTDPDGILDWVYGQAGVSQHKAWENTRVQIPGSATPLWTSSAGKKFTDFSPGQIVVVCVAPPSNAGSLTLLLNWDVTVSQPSLENVDTNHLFEYNHTLTKDVVLTWYPQNGCYACLMPASQPPSFDPEMVHDHDEPIDFGEYGLGDVKAGDYLMCDTALPYSTQFTSGSGKIVTTTSVRIFKAEVLPWSGATSVPKLILTPMVRFHKADGSGYDIEYAGYVNSVGTGAYTWSDVYAGVHTLHAGSKFATFDPTALYESEEVTAIRGGKLVKVPTGRVVRKVAAVPASPDTIPFVRVYGSDNNATTSQVVVTNFPDVQGVRVVEPAKVSFDGPQTVTTSGPLPISGDVNITNLPATQSVAVTNFPETQAITTSGPLTVNGDVSVANLPVTQAVRWDEHLPVQVMNALVPVALMQDQAHVYPTHVVVDNTEPVVVRVDTNDAVPVNVTSVFGQPVPEGVLPVVSMAHYGGNSKYGSNDDYRFPNASHPLPVMLCQPGDGHAQHNDAQIWYSCQNDPSAANADTISSSLRVISGEVPTGSDSIYLCVT